MTMNMLENKNDCVWIVTPRFNSEERKIDKQLSYYVIYIIVGVYKLWSKHFQNNKWSNWFFHISSTRQKRIQYLGSITVKYRNRISSDSSPRRHKKRKWTHSVPFSLLTQGTKYTETKNQLFIICNMKSTHDNIYVDLSIV